MATRALSMLLLRRVVTSSSSWHQATTTSSVCASLHELPHSRWQVQATGAVLFPRGAGLSNKAGGDESLATRSVDEEPKRKIINRILYRARQRGYLELDLLLGKWAEDNASQLDETRLRDLVNLLEEENPDLWNWLTGQAEVPPELTSNTVFTAIRDQITGNLKTFSSPKTRAQPGQPWVRGWDDNRKSGGPQVGNQ